MKVIQLTLWAMVMSFISLYAMEKEMSPLEDIKKYNSEKFLNYLDSVKDFDRDGVLILLQHVLNEVYDLNNNWLEFTLIQRSLPDSIENKSFSMNEEGFKANMQSLAVMADRLKDIYEKKFQKNVFLDLRAADKNKGFLNWKRYLHCQVTAQAIIDRINQDASLLSSDNQKFGAIEILESVFNVIFYSCILSNEQKNILVNTYFLLDEPTESIKFIKSILTSPNFLSLRGFDAPLIQKGLVEKSGKGYGYINLVDITLINGEIGFLEKVVLNQLKVAYDQKDTLSNMFYKLEPVGIDKAFNNVCLDKDNKPRVALDLLVIWIMEEEDRKIGVYRTLIETIFKGTNEKFLKESIKLGNYNYTSILNWLQEQLKMVGKDNKRKVKINELIKLLTDLLPKQKVETVEERKKREAKEKRERNKQKEKTSEISSAAILSSTTETSALKSATISEEKPKEVEKPKDEFEGLINAINANDADNVQKILNGKTITDDELAKVALLNALGQGITFNENLIINIKDFRSAQASKKSDENIKRKLEESQAKSQKNQTIIRELSKAILNLRQILSTLDDTKWVAYMMLSDDVHEKSIIKNMLVDSVNYKDKEKQMLDALYSTIFNSQALSNDAKIGLIDFYASQNKKDSNHLVMLRDLLISKKYLDLAGINTPILSTGETLLYEAVKRGNPALVEFLLEYGASADVTIPELPVITALKEFGSTPSLKLKRIIALLTQKMSNASKEIMEKWIEKEKESTIEKGDIKKFKSLENIEKAAVNKNEKVVLTPEQKGKILAANALLMGTSKKDKEEFELLELEPSLEKKEEIVTETKEVSPAVTEATRMVTQKGWAERYKTVVQETYNKAAATANDWYTWIKNKVQSGAAAIQQGATGWYNYLVGGNPRPASAGRP